MAEHFSFDRIQMRRMVKQLIREELEPREDIGRRPGNHYHAIDHVVGTAYSTIAARSGGTPGTGQVQAKKFVTGTAADYANTAGNLVDVLNFGAAITSGSYVVCHRHRESGKWIVEVPQGGSNSSTSAGIALWSAHMTTDQTSIGTIEFNTELFTRGGIWSFNTGTYTLTVNATGYVQFTVKLPHTNAYNGGNYALLVKNGSEVDYAGGMFVGQSASLGANLVSTLTITTIQAVSSGDAFLWKCTGSAGLTIFGDVGFYPPPAAHWDALWLG